MISAGNLRHRVAVQTATETKDAEGGVVFSWATDNTRWASIEWESGEEGIDADQTDATRMGTVRMRYYSTLTPQQRLLFGTRALNIISVHHDMDGIEETVVRVKEDI